MKKAKPCRTIILIMAAILLSPAVLFLLFYGAHRLEHSLSYHSCICDEPMGLDEYYAYTMSKCGNFFAPRLYHEEELLEGMSQAFGSEFTIVRKRTLSPYRRTYVMTPEFDDSLEITVETWSDPYWSYDEETDTYTYGVKRKACHDYYKAVLDRYKDEILSIASEYGLDADIKIDINMDWGWHEIDVIVSEYCQLDAVCALYSEANELLGLHSFDTCISLSSPDRDEAIILIDSPSGIRLDVELDGEKYGYDIPPSNRYFIDNFWFKHDGETPEESMLADLQHKYAIRLERDHLSDPTIPRQPEDDK